MKSHIIKIQKGSGYILLITGVMIITGKENPEFISKYLPFLGKLG